MVKSDKLWGNMRDIKNVRPLNISLKRNILMFVTPLLVMLLAYIFFMIPTAHAAPATDIAWKENTIVYANQTYTGPTIAQADDGHDLPQGTILYTYLEPRAPFSSQKSHVIYFDADIDPTKATSAQYVTYDRNTTGGLSGKSPPKELTIDTATSPSASTSTNDSPSTCKIDGIGWIVCSVSNFLATGMDWVFGVLSGFVEVQPLATSSGSVMYRIWDMMRVIANIAFVIAFLVIIYAQLTSSSISNYGIKKILPRVIVAAILVNVSYWICVVAIDASNILGHSLQGIFLSLRDNVLEEGSGNGWQLVSWESVTSFILAGGAAGGATLAGLVGLSATMGAFSVAGVALLLAPILVGAFLTILVVLFILAARQAIITLLVIISPLALVAYLLPNTEKWFEKWRSLFMTMLIFFPAFSLVFGGAQFAGLTIIQTATNINMILLGMAVQIAPLAITPLLLKLSGSLLSKVAGIINDPSKGLKDRTKNWSKDRLAARKASEDLKTRQMAKDGTLRARHVMRRTALSADNRRRLREGKKAVDESRATSLFGASSMGHALDEAERDAERQKKIVHNQHEESWNIKAKIDPGSLEKELQLRITTDQASLATAKMNSVYEEVKAGNRTHIERVYGNTPLSPSVDSDAMRRIDMLNRASDTTAHLAVEGMRKSAAEHEQKSNLAKSLLKNDVQVDGSAIRDYAGGIDEHGANSALATAVGIDRKQYGDRVNEANAIIDHFNLSGSQRQMHAMGKEPVTVTDSNGNSITLDNNSTFTREAVIEGQLSGKGNMEQMEEIILASGGELKAFRTTISSAIPKNGIPGKAAYWGGVSIDNVAQGKIKSKDDLNAVVTRFLGQGKVKPSQLATMDLTAIKNIVNAYQRPDDSLLSAEDRVKLPAYLAALQKSAYQALNSDDLKGDVADNVKPELEKLIMGYTPPSS